MNFDELVLAAKEREATLIIYPSPVCPDLGGGLSSVFMLMTTK